MKRIPIIIDTDPGTDDALALLMALSNEEKLDVKLITTTEGNTPIDVTTKNALYMVENYAKYDVPVAMGDKVISQTVVRADDVHGANGLGDVVVGRVNKKIIGDKAVDAMYKTLMSSKEKIVIVAIGPLSNVAELLEKYPDCKSRIEYIYSMSGSIDGNGNITPYAEFNAYFNPTAMDVVLRSGVKFVMNSMTLGLQLAMPNQWFYDHGIISKKDQFIYDIVHGCHDALLSEFFVPYDILSIYGLLYPEEFDFKQCEITMNLDNDKYGQTVVDLGVLGNKYVQIVKNKDFTIKHLFEEIYK